MTITKLISMAKNTELQQLSFKDDVEVVLDFINLGILEIYKRFALDISEYVIHLDENESEYKMPEGFMYLTRAFTEIEEIQPNGELSVGAYEIPINDADALIAVNTVNWDTVQIPFTAEFTAVSLIYVASPQLIEYIDGEFKVYNDFTDSYDTIINMTIPPQLIEALLHYVGYRGNAAITADMTADANNSFYQRFELSCKKVTDMGMFNMDALITKNINNYKRIIAWV